MVDQLDNAGPAAGSSDTPTADLADAPPVDARASSKVHSALPPLANLPAVRLPPSRLGDVAAMLRVLEPLAPNSPDPAARNRQLLADFCRLVGAQAGKPTPAQFRIPDDLPPRQGQTLRLLLAGDSEKQVALKLKLSRHTVHSYVKSLYRKYKVGTRAELLAKFLGS